MSEDKKTLKDIKSGKGLPPIPKPTTDQSSGLTKEQREKYPGLSIENYTYDKSKGNGN